MDLMEMAKDGLDGPYLHACKHGPETVESQKSWNVLKITILTALLGCV